MIIKQTFRVGEEEQCGEEFFAVVPDDPDLVESLEAALEVVLNSIYGYMESFTLELDTEKRSVEVVDLV